MICPNCGEELADDMLYCEKCGSEIQFVPDYEPEIEQQIDESITETLSEIQLMDEDGVFGDEFGRYSEGYDQPVIESFYDDNGVYFEGYYDETGAFILLGYMGEDGVFMEYPEGVYYDSFVGGTNEYYDESMNPVDGDMDIQNMDFMDLDADSSNEIRKNRGSEKKSTKNTSTKAGNTVDKPVKKTGNSKRPTRKLDPLESAAYKRPEGLVHIKPPSRGPRISHNLSDSLYDEMYDNEGLQKHLDSLGEEYDLDPFDDFAYEGYLLKRFTRFIKSSRLKWVILAVLLVFVIFIIVGISKVTGKIKQNTSFEYQIQLSNEAAARGDYAGAIEYMEKAISLKSSDLNINNSTTDLKYTLVDLYFKNNDEDSAILTLWDIVKANDSNSPFAYRRILDFYIQRNDYKTINEVLLSCDDQSIKDEFGSYMAEKPVFSAEEGTYEDPFELTLSTTIPGFIYYTTDGTEPTEESELYMAPIYLDMGIYRISATFVNQYGIKSETVSKTYTLDRRVPDPPKVMTAEGEYSSPELIEVDVQPYTRVFYTTDGTMPTMDSLEYKSPLPMPIGSSRITFIAYSTEDIPGPTTEASYYLNVNTPLDVIGMANNLVIYDFRTGKAVDANGFIPGNSQRYTYSATQAIVLENNIYYIYAESLIDNYGTITKTGTIYLVDTVNGSVWTATKDEDNVITRGSVIDPQLYAPLPEENEDNNND